MAERRNAMDFKDHASVGAWYDGKYVDMCGGWFTPTEEIDNHLYVLGVPSDARGLRLVDLGCGDGQFLERALNLGADCIGVDVSMIALRFAWQRYTRLVSSRNAKIGMLKLRHVPMESTQLESASFDFAMSMGAMEHALDIPAAVAEMSRLLKVDGSARWMLYVPNDLWRHFDQPLETTAPAEWWVQLAEQSGLVVTNVETLNDNSRITGIKPRSRA